MSRGILRGVHDGVITSTSVLVLGSGFSRSVGWLRDEGQVGVGVHLALVGEDPPLTPAREIPTLVDRRGRLPRSWRQLLPKVMAKRIDLADVERELAAQIGAAQDAGLSIDHLNSHQHVHMFPGLREVVVDLAHRFDVPAIRVTRSTGRGPVGRLMRRLATTLERELQADGIAFPGDAAGLDEAGRFDERRMLRALDRFASRRVVGRAVGSSGRGRGRRTASLPLGLPLGRRARRRAVASCAPGHRAPRLPARHLPRSRGDEALRRDVNDARNLRANPGPTTRSAGAVAVRSRAQA